MYLWYVVVVTQEAHFSVQVSGLTIAIPMEDGEQGVGGIGGSLCPTGRTHETHFGMYDS